MGKKVLFAVFIVVLAVTLQARNIEVNGINYKVISIEAPFKIAVSTQSAVVENLEIPSVVTYNDTLFEVTEILPLAFYNRNELRTLLVPGSIQKIGSYAFQSCRSLVGVQIGVPLQPTTTDLIIETTSFAGCSALAMLTLHRNMKLNSGNTGAFPNLITLIVGEGVEYVGDYMFNKSVNLQSVSLPYSVKRTGVASFGSCSSLTLVEMSGVVELGYQSFMNCTSLSELRLPANLQTIGPESFRGCTGLSSVMMNNVLETIGSGAFSDCVQLVEVSIPSSVVTIGSSAFANCRGVNLVNLGDETVKNSQPLIISASSFSGCSKFTRLNLHRSIQLNSSASGAFRYITHLVAGNQVEFIGDHVFGESSNLTTVQLAPSIKSLGLGSFQYCTKLPSLEMPGVQTIGRQAFFGCSLLESVQLNEGLTVLEEETFRGCAALKSLLMNATLTTIKGGVFYDCAQLSALHFPATLREIGNEAFYNCKGLTTLQLNEGLRSIGTDCFAFCSSLTSLEIPSTLTSISTRSFQNCSGIQGLIIPSEVEFLAGEAFLKCTGVTSVEIKAGPANVAELRCGTVPFSGCSGVKSLIINRNIAEDPLSSPFMSFTALETVSIGERVTHLNSFAFYGCTKLTKLVIPASVTSISVGAFQGCSSLTEITLPPTLYYLPAQLFYGCKLLKAVRIPGDVRSIGNYTFYDCASLDSLVIPSGVKVIGPLALSGCTGLKKLVSAASTPALAGFNSFSKIDPAVCELVVPTGSSSFYQQAEQWNVFARISEAQLSNENPAGTVAGKVEVVTSRGQLINDLPVSLRPGLFYLIVKGTLSAADLSYIRAMPVLKFLDLTEAVIDGNTLPASTFSGMNSLISIALPTTLTSIGTRAFEQCYGLVDIVLPEGLTTIENSAFARCDRLMTVKFPSTLTTIKASAFYECTGLFSVELPESLTTLESNVFVGCNGIRKITLPASISQFSEHAFANCAGLQEVTIHSKVSALPWGMFTQCVGLKKVILPATLKTLGSEVFSGCRNLNTIYSYATVPPTSSDVMLFYNVNQTNFKLYVPYGTLSQYRSSALWGQFPTIIEMAPAGVSDSELLQLRLYPNPSTEGFSVSGLEGEGRLYVYGLDGKMLISGAIVDGEFVSMRGFSAGTYLVRITAGKKEKELKLILL